MFSISDVVTKLAGEIYPVGETNRDEKRLENLEQVCTMVEKFLFEIAEVAELADRPEHSIQQAGKQAAKFLDCIYEDVFKNKDDD